MRIQSFEISPLKAPLNQPFRTSLGAHQEMENVLFVLRLDNGLNGFGEAAIATHITGETIAQTVRNLKNIGGELIGRSVEDYKNISVWLHRKLSENKAALAAVEMAVLDGLTKGKRIPLWKFFGPRCQKIRTDITIVIADLKETEESVKRFYKQGFRTFKIKIGKDFDLDLKRVEAVHRSVKKTALILDANQGFTARQTIRFIDDLGQLKIVPVLLEQPVAKKDWDGLAEISRKIKIPVCADESVQSLADAQKIIKKKIVKAINLKFMKTGILEAHAIALLAKKNNIKLMIGGMMESSLAMTASAHLAAGLGFIDFIDLDTPFFIKKGFDRNPYLSRDGVYDLKKVKRGIGIYD